MRGLQCCWMRASFWARLTFMGEGSELRVAIKQDSERAQLGEWLERQVGGEGHAEECVCAALQEAGERVALVRDGFHVVGAEEEQALCLGGRSGGAKPL